ncbi:MAG TPA: hypothetical protein VF498_17040 [Anaerolineales bacterium]
MLGELFAPASWGLLWGLFLLAALNPRRLTTGEGYLLVSVLAYIGLMSGAFLFSAWQPFTLHIESALQRLLLHVAPAALLFVSARMGEIDDWIKLWAKSPE